VNETLFNDCMCYEIIGLHFLSLAANGLHFLYSPQGQTSIVCVNKKTHTRVRYVCVRVCVCVCKCVCVCASVCACV